MEHVKTSYNIIHRGTGPDGKYAAEKRRWIGCPSVQVTGKRVWASGFSGGKYEPSRLNHSILMYSDDGGKTWVDPYMIVACDETRDYRGLDGNLWLDPKGRLWFTWEQAHFEHGLPEPTYDETDYEFLMKYFDADITCWAILCENPEADEPLWSEPRYLFPGVLRNKPIALSNGTWMFCPYKAAALEPRYTYYLSYDEGQTFLMRQGPKRLPSDQCPFEEPMCVETENGHLLFMVRTNMGYIAMSESNDYGETWGETADTDRKDPSSRFFLYKLASGKILLVNTPRSDARTGMRAFLSDDGKRWVHSLTLDTRCLVSYPDGCQDTDGNIWIVYDCQRDNRQEPVPWNDSFSFAAKELVLTKFREQDLIAGDYVTKEAKMPHWFSKVMDFNRTD